MSGASFSFLAFAAAVVLVTNLFRAAVWRRAVLLAASLVFVWLASGGLTLWPLAGFLALGYALIKLMEAGRVRLLAPAVFLVILVFAWLKRYSFLPAFLFLPFPYATLGISYIVFRVLDLIVDAAGGELRERVGPFSYLTYTLNFTSLVAGPIQQYRDFERIPPEAGRLTVIRAGRGIERIVRGIFKVNVLAMVFSMAQTQGLAALTPGATWQTRLLAASVVFASYPFFLYCNFSGYIDVVIGIAGLLDMDLPENFDRPFSSDSFLGFWSRWHITLSEWLKKHVYNHVLMALIRRYPAERLAPVWGVGSFFLTFFLVGVWHGPTPAFLFFGVLQGFGVSANKLYQVAAGHYLGRKGYKALAARPLYIAVCRGLTFTWFAFTMVWFWSNWSQIGELAEVLGAAGLIEVWSLILLAATVGLAVWEHIRGVVTASAWAGDLWFGSRYARTAWTTAMATISVVTGILVRQPSPEIVYKAF